MKPRPQPKATGGLHAQDRVAKAIADGTGREPTVDEVDAVLRHMIKGMTAAQRTRIIDGDHVVQLGPDGAIAVHKRRPHHGWKPAPKPEPDNRGWREHVRLRVDVSQQPDGTSSARSPAFPHLLARGFGTAELAVAALLKLVAEEYEPRMEAHK